MAGRMKSQINPNGPIGNQNRDLPACSTMLQPMRHRVPLNALSSRRRLPMLRGILLSPYTLSQDRIYLRTFAKHNTGNKLLIS